MPHRPQNPCASWLVVGCLLLAGTDVHATPPEQTPAEPASQQASSASRLERLAQQRQNAFAAGDTARAEQIAYEHLWLAQSLGDPAQLARAQIALGEILRRQGRIDEALSHLQAALPALRAQANEGRSLAQALSTLAQLRRNLGDYYEAFDLETEALALRRSLDPPERPHLSLFSLAALYEQMEDFDRALEKQYEALVVARQDPDPAAEASAITRLAGLLNDLRPDQPDEALGYATLGFAAHQQRGNRPGMLDARFHMGRAHLNAGRLEEAGKMFDLAFAEAVSLNQRSSQAHIQFRRAQLYLTLGEVERARATLQDAIDRYHELGNRHRLAKAHGMLASIATASGDEPARLRALVEHYRLRDELLGAAATRRVNDLVERYRQSSEEARIGALQRDNRIQQLQLEQARTKQQMGIAMLLLSAGLLATLGWRHLGSVSHNRKLQGQSRLLEAQQEALSTANQRLAAQAEELRALAEVDGLTGLANRRHGMHLMEELLRRASTSGADIGVFILDLDNFKEFNDRYGHPVGDEILRRASSVMASVLSRPGMILARLGGEEFGVALTDAERLEEVAEQVRARIAALRIPYRQEYLSLTVSIGVVRRSQLAGCDLAELLRAADQALYAAKRSGRNRVVAWPPPLAGKVVDLHA
jgi:diguanylate cyclase (GGDEF)-like protein